LKYVICFKKPRFNILVSYAENRIKAINIVKNKYPTMIENEDFEVLEITDIIEPYFKGDEVLEDG